METASEPELAKFAQAAQSGGLLPMENEVGYHHPHKVHKECERGQHPEGCGCDGPRQFVPLVRRRKRPANPCTRSRATLAASLLSQRAPQLTRRALCAQKPSEKPQRGDEMQRNETGQDETETSERLCEICDEPLLAGAPSNQKVHAGSCRKAHDAKKKREQRQRAKEWKAMDEAELRTTLADLLEQKWKAMDQGKTNIAEHLAVRRARVRAAHTPTLLTNAPWL